MDVGKGCDFETPNGNGQAISLIPLYTCLSEAAPKRPRLLLAARGHKAYRIKLCNSYDEVSTVGQSVSSIIGISPTESVIASCSRAFYPVIF